MLTHVVLMKFTDAADAAKAKDLLEGLVSEVPAIRTLHVGVDELRTPFSWDLALTTTHDDVPGLLDYQNHPAHLEVAGWLKPRLASRAVVDFN